MWLEHLPSKCKALNSNPITTKKFQLNQKGNNNKTAVTEMVWRDRALGIGR
jgi:hypothetical protein